MLALCWRSFFLLARLADSWVLTIAGSSNASWPGACVGRTSPPWLPAPGAGPVSITTARMSTPPTPREGVLELAPGVGRTSGSAPALVSRSPAHVSMGRGSRLPRWRSWKRCDSSRPSRPRLWTVSTTMGPEIFCLRIASTESSRTRAIKEGPLVSRTPTRILTGASST